MPARNDLHRRVYLGDVLDISLPISANDFRLKIAESVL